MRSCFFFSTKLTTVFFNFLKAVPPFLVSAFEVLQYFQRLPVFHPEKWTIRLQEGILRGSLQEEGGQKKKKKDKMKIITWLYVFLLPIFYHLFFVVVFC